LLTLASLVLLIKVHTVFSNSTNLVTLKIGGKFSLNDGTDLPRNRKVTLWYYESGYHLSRLEKL